MPSLVVIQDDSKGLIVLAVDAEEHPSPVKSSIVCPRFDAWAAPTAQRSLRSLVHLKPRYKLLEEATSGSDSDYSSSWISWFLSSKGNEYFCEVDEDFILDRFNLTGLNNEVTNYSQALDLITDNLDDEIQDELRGSLDVQARLLYGLIHARWIVTARGLQKMIEKYKRADFGRCPRVFCQLQPLLPVGLTDVPYEKSVKLYCGRCEDLYSPKSARHGSIDGAYFGTTFPHLLFLVYPSLIPPKSGPSDLGPATKDGERRTKRMREEQEAPTEGGGDSISTASVALKVERYRPKIYGFQLNETARLQRWQEAIRDRQITRLEALEDRA
ncbi:Casein kinase II subunit beta-2 [Termitomyces sp. J132]|nr:Casein kinase II subunit beta-2 [Termitomyces sp. J132]